MAESSAPDHVTRELAKGRCQERVQIAVGEIGREQRLSCGQLEDLMASELSPWCMEGTSEAQLTVQPRLHMSAGGPQPDPMHTSGARSAEGWIKLEGYSSVLSAQQARTYIAGEDERTLRD